MKPGEILAIGSVALLRDPQTEVATQPSITPARAARLVRLVARARARLWLASLVRLLVPALWVSALLVGVGGLVRWQLGVPGLALLATLAILPVVTAVFATLVQRPTRDQAAAAADAWLGADALLLTAWHIEQRPGGMAAAAPLVAARAERACTDWGAGLRAGRPPLPSGGLTAPLFVLLAGAPLLALETPMDPPAADRGVALAAERVSPHDTAAPLVDLVAQMKETIASAVPTTSNSQTDSRSPAAAEHLAMGPPGAQVQAQGSAERTPLDEPGGHQATDAGIDTRTPMPAAAIDVAVDPAPPTAAGTLGSDAGEGRDAAGTQAPSRTSGTDSGAPAALPEQMNRLERRGARRVATTATDLPVIAPSADARDTTGFAIGAPATASAPPAELPRAGIEQDPKVAGPAARALVARYYQIRQQHHE